MLLTSLSFSQGSQKSTNLDPDYRVSVAYRYIIKANQAYIEVKHSRVQIDTLESIISRKDETIQKLIGAHALSHNLNMDYQTTFKAQQKTIRKCEEYAGTIEFKNKQLKAKNGFIQIGTPVLLVGVGTLCMVGGYYIRKLTE